MALTYGFRLKQSDVLTVWHKREASFVSDLGEIVSRRLAEFTLKQHCLHPAIDIFSSIGEKFSPMATTPLPLNAIRAFEAAARRGSFAEAAADLHVTHWAIGKQIRLLEEWLGVPLFERRGRGIALTDEGSDLLANASTALSLLAQSIDKLRRPGARRRISGMVRVNVQPSFALRWLFPRLPDFQELHPNVTVQVSTTSRKLRSIGTTFDVSVRTGHAKSKGLRSEFLLSDRRLPVCRPDLLRKRPIESPHDLRRHTLLHSLTTRSAWSCWLAEVGIPRLAPSRELEFEHVYLQLEAAANGLGVALASLPLVEGDIAAGRVVCPIAAPEWHTTPYELVINEDRAADVAVQAFRKWLLTAAGSRGAAATLRSSRTDRPTPTQ
jgi:LysR family glycine cleavage system transcriptional activator